MTKTTSTGWYEKLYNCNVGEIITIDGIQYIQVEEYDPAKRCCDCCAFGADNSICSPNSVMRDLPCKVGAVFKTVTEVIGDD